MFGKEKDPKLCKWATIIIDEYLNTPSKNNYPIIIIEEIQSSKIPLLLKDKLKISSLFSIQTDCEFYGGFDVKIGWGSSWAYMAKAYNFPNSFPKEWDGKITGPNLLVSEDGVFEPSSHPEVLIINKYFKPLWNPKHLYFVGN